MYIYKVTHTSSLQYYVGYEVELMHNSSKHLDPMKVFETEFGYNGVSATTILSKEVIKRVGSKDEAKDFLATYAKEHSNISTFLGVKMAVAIPKVKIEPTPAVPVAEKTGSVKK